MFNGATSQPIGSGKVDKHFFANLDQDARHLIWGAADTINKVVFWCFPEPGGGGDCDRLMMFNWSTGAWSEASNDFGGGALATYMIYEDKTQGYTLDGLDAVGTDIDDGWIVRVFVR